MEKKELITIKMPMSEALNIIKQVLTDKNIPENYDFQGWNNTIPASCLNDKDAIHLTFKKTSEA